MKIAVVGTGYVGLVTGTCFAETGNHVTCIDVDAAKIKRMQDGIVPIYERDLDGLFERNIKEKRLKFTTALLEGVKDAAIIFLALPTPANKDGAADLSYIYAVADKLGELLDNYTVIITKSTVPVGTAERIRQRISQKAKADFDVVSNPEFLREGFAVSDFLKPDRIVVGSSSEKAKKILTELYEPFTREGSPLIFMDERSAELTKYAANSFLAAKISFMNEIANLCELTGADVDSIRLGIGADERIGRRFLFPGIGYGGSCFPKDIMALTRIAQEHDYDFKILAAVSDVNANQKQKLVNKVRDYFSGQLEGKTFALWGLAFKPDTDDIREAPSLEIIKSLSLAGANIVAYDPQAAGNVKRYFANQDDIRLKFVDDAYVALQGANALLIATEWHEFRTPDFTKLKKLLKQPLVFDGRNLYDLETIKAENIHYESIGRKVIQ